MNCLSDAIKEIDDLLGPGAALKHPTVLAAVIADHTAQHDRAFWSGQIAALSESLRSDHPLQGETLGGIEGALNAIADAVSSLKSTPKSQDEIINDAFELVDDELPSRRFRLVRIDGEDTTD